jgi:hypothetical protein
LSDSIVQVLVDIRRRDRVDGRDARIPCCGGEGLVDGYADLIEPWKFGNVLEARRRIHVDDREG